MPMNRGLYRFSAPPRPGDFPWDKKVLASGLLAARPPASWANLGFRYFASNVVGGTEYQCQLLSGVPTWVQVAPGVTLTTYQPLVYANVGIAAAGTTQGTATALTAGGTSPGYSIQEVTSVGAGQGVRLPPDTVQGGCHVVINGNSTTPLLVYPNTGENINALAANSPVQLAPKERASFYFVNSIGGSTWYCDQSIVIGASVYPSANYVLANATYTALACNTELFDSNTLHDTVTNNSRITVPAGLGGKWFLIAIVGGFLSTGASQAIAEFGPAKNGSFVADLSCAAGAVTMACDVTTAVATDYFELIEKQNSGASQTMLASGSLYPRLVAIYLGN